MAFLQQLQHSLFGKISLVYLVLLLTLGGLLTFVALRFQQQFIYEADQRLNATLAANLADEFGPFLADSLDYEGVKETMHYLMVMNPHVEIYLLSEAGSVLAFFADPAKVKLAQVDLAPIHQFLEDDFNGPIYGDDPRNPGETKPFSVSPIQFNGTEAGYLYVVLRGEAYDSALDLVQRSAIGRLLMWVALIVVLFTAIVGLVLVALLTRRFRAMTTAVRRFQRGDYGQRILTVHAEDEVGQLAQAFNRMAETIQTNVAELERTDTMRRELIANISHDLRSPLASIQGYVETIQMKANTLDAEQRDLYLRIILDNTTMLNKLVSSLFDLSKLDAQQVTPHLEAFPIAELVHDVVMMFQPQAGQRGITLAADLAADVPLVRADIGLIERVLTNLIENALRYTPHGGSIYAGVEVEPAHVRVYVADSGPGIPADEIPRLFERFYRVDKSRTRTSGGSGLGLSIAHKILVLHATELEIESTLNVGTTMAFRLESVVPALRADIRDAAPRLS